MELIESRLFIARKKGLAWLCPVLSLGFTRHRFELVRSAGMPGELGSYKVERCILCGLQEHVFLEERELTEDEMRARAEKETRGFEAMMWLLDNVEPDYAAGRGTENGRIVDRDEPWQVPLEERHPSAAGDDRHGEGE